jgi:glucose/arabinose dehydrogenase
MTQNTTGLFALAGIGIIVLFGGLIYFFLWDVGSAILPYIHKIERTEATDPSLFTLPEGFSASVFSDQVPGARVMTRDPRGTLVVSLTDDGKVVALPNTDADQKADKVVTILSGLTSPHGILFYCGELGNPGDGTGSCYLFVAESDALTRYAYNPDTFTATFEETMTTFPNDGGHYTRTIDLAPDAKSILVSVGSSCNVCVEKNEDRASVVTVDIVTNKKTQFAKGLRNTVFMNRHPLTGDLWGTDMGRDLLGDDIPPDEINIITQDGNYGWPICYGKNIHDTNFDKNTYIRNPCMEPFEAPSLVDIPAHSAPLGIVFVPEEGWPEEYWHDALVAYHGSWNRSVPTGYKIVRFKVDDRTGLPTGEVTDFMTGFMDENGDILGRPVHMLIEPGGTMYVTDDRAGAIYRITLAPN